MMIIWAVELSVCLVITGGLMWKLDKQEEHLSELRAKSQSMAPYRKMIEEGNRQLSDIRPRLSTLQTAGQFTDRWIRVLQHLGEMPPRTWLTGIRVTQGKSDKDQDQVTFTGYAESQALVGDVMLSLNNCADLSDVQLKFTKEREQGLNNGVEFEVFAKLADNRPPKADTPTKEGAAANVGS